MENSIAQGKNEQDLQGYLPEGILHAQETVAELLAEDGCPWHREQDHPSLVKYLIEECYECVDAIDALATFELRADSKTEHAERACLYAHLCEELGDVLYQVLFHAALAAEDPDGFTFDELAERLAVKLERRHPHVFGDAGWMSAQELRENWEQLKAQAAGSSAEKRSVVEGIARSLPSLARAQKIVQRIAYSGQAPTALLSSLAGGAKRPVHADSTKNAPGLLTRREVGFRMLELIAAAQEQGIDADEALRVASEELAATVENTIASSSERT